jgi:calcineurin-like phosphoesterase family protein
VAKASLEIRKESFGFSLRISIWIFQHSPNVRDMTKIFFTSDLHFGHKNIIRHCHRPFATVEEMDEAMFFTWNRKVAPEDTVYVLGDFAFESAKRAQQALDRLKGKKILIVGNHDKFSGVSGWESVHDMLTLQVGENRLFLCHYPMRDWPGKWHGVIHLYGHVHGNLIPEPGSMDVGVDVWGGAPVSLEEILEFINPFAPKPSTQSFLRFRAWEP